VPSFVRSRESYDDFYDPAPVREDTRRFATLQPRDVKDFQRYAEYENNKVGDL